MLANGMSVSELVSQLGSRFNEADLQDDQPKNMKFANTQIHMGKSLPIPSLLIKVYYNFTLEPHLS